MALKPYSGNPICCPKCHHDEAGTEYRPASDKYDTPERIRRYCRNCGYFWFEAPLDAAQK